MAKKEYLKMEDVPDFPGFETHRDIDYLKSTPESWSEDYRRVFKSEQTAKRNTTRMFVYSKQLLGLLIQSIDQTNELVVEVGRLREMLSECYPYVKDVADWGNAYDKDLKNRVFDSCGIKQKS